MANVFVGKVVSINLQKSAVVEVKRVRRHPLYKKLMRRSKRLTVHNENTDVKVGDSVRIIETRPMSKTKHFKIL